MKLAQNAATAERNNVAGLLDRLLILQPHDAGEAVTKFSNGVPSPWVDCHAWFVDKAGVPTPIGADRGTAVRIWAEVLVPTLADSLAEYVAARVIRPSTAYLFDELDAAEVKRCEQAVKALTPAVEESF